MTLDLHTLEKIRAEVEKKKDVLPWEPNYCQSRNGIYYCGTCEQPWDDCSCSARNTGHVKALTDLLHYLDTEIANAKGL